jgi:D-arginine dehydrogenase
MRENVQHVDVLVVGAGLAGASTAWWLKRAGVEKVLLLERESVPGAHASGKNAGIARQATDDSLITLLAARSVSFLRNPPKGFTELPLLSANGGFITSRTPADQRLGTFHTNAMAAGVYTYHPDRIEVLERVPVLQQAPFQSALACPMDGFVDIHGLLGSYLKSVPVLTDVEVTGFETSPRKVRAVETTRGTFSAEWIVNAAGAWAQVLADQAGAQEITLTPRRRHLLHSGPVRWVDQAGPYVWSMDPEVYFRPESGGLLMSPCDAAIVPPGTPPLDPEVPLLLAQRLSEAFPKMAALPVARSWAELRVFSPDQGFVIGRDTKLHNFLWVAGLGGHGMTTSAAVGELASSIITGTDPFIDPEPFSPKRFA